MAAPRPSTSDAGTDTQFDVAVMRAAAVRGEVVVSFARLVVCALVLVRFFLIDDPGQSTLATGATCGAVVGWLVSSLVALTLARRGRLTIGWIIFSPVFDAIFCFLLLLPSALPLAPSQVGIVRSPQDMTLILLVVLAAGFRLLPKAAVLGALASCVCVASLVILDVSTGNTSFGAELADIVQYLLVFAGCATLTVATAMRTRKLALAAVKGARRSERAQHGLESLMQEHHDMRAVLSAAAINSSMVLRALIDSSRAPGGLEDVARDLREDLREASRAIHRIKQQAYTELTTLTDVVQVDVRPALDRVVSATRRRFSHIEIVWENTEESVAAVIGGADGLERMVANLLNNACEGDGTKTATRVELTVEVDADDVTVTVADNGPGFPSIALTESRAGYPTTKPEGSGLGLLLVEGLVQASGGRLEKNNRNSGGACVRLILKAQPPES